MKNKASQHPDRWWFTWSDSDVLGAEVLPLILRERIRKVYSRCRL